MFLLVWHLSRNNTEPLNPKVSCRNILSSIIMFINYHSYALIYNEVSLTLLMWNACEWVYYKNSMHSML